MTTRYSVALGTQSTRHSGARHSVATSSLLAVVLLLTHGGHEERTTSGTGCCVVRKHWHYLLQWDWKNNSFHKTVASYYSYELCISNHLEITLHKFHFYWYQLISYCWGWWSGLVGMAGLLQMPDTVAHDNCCITVLHISTQVFPHIVTTVSAHADVGPIITRGNIPWYTWWMAIHWN
jgi:hypothetical protein